MKFNEEKTTQMCAFILERLGGRVPYIKAQKLLYFADREMLKATGYFATGDEHYLMRFGPVLSTTLNLMREDQPAGAAAFWNEFIATDQYDLVLKKKAPADLLSPADIEVLTMLLEKYGKMDKWDVVDESHKLPEVHDVDHGCVRLSASTILHHLGHSKEAAAEQAKLHTSIFA